MKNAGQRLHSMIVEENEGLNDDDDVVDVVDVQFWWQLEEAICNSEGTTYEAGAF